MFKNVLVVLFLVLFCGQTWSQVTVEFRISAVSSDVGDMDPLAFGGNGGNSDPRWEFQATDVPFGTTQTSFQFNANLNCPGSIGLANTFFSQTYCSAPTSFNFQWRGYERDAAGVGQADTGPQIINIPIGSLAFPQAAFTPVATYSFGVAGTVGCPGVAGTVTWTITLEYRTVGTLPPDQTLPTITCPSDVSSTVDVGLCTSSSVALGIPVTADNCSVLSVTNNAPAVFPLGVTNVTWTVTDPTGNSATCNTQDVTVTDIENPTILCPANVIVNNDVGLCTASGVTLGVPIDNDNCSVLSVTNDGVANYPIGTTVVTWTVTDGSLNTASCAQTVTVNDTQNPTIVCPADITQNNDAGVCGATVAYATPVGADNCPGSITTLTAGLASGSVFPSGLTTVTYLVTDASSNTSTCSFDVTVDDVEVPVIVCPGNITQNNDATVCGAIVVYATPVGTDNCAGSITTLTGGLASGSLFPIGTTAVTYEVEDLTSNITSCSFNVTVNDTENPTIVCPANITQSNDVGVCGATVTYATPVGADNCPGSITTLTAGQASATLFPIGATTVTYLVTDASTNTATCSFTVTVNDTQNPTIVCPANITQNNDAAVCGATVTYATPVGADNCPGSITTLTAGQASGTLFPIGATTVTYLVTDASTNTATCSFTVTVNDTQNPTIVCPADITQNNDAGVCGATVAYATPVGADNCPGSITTLTAGLASGSVFPSGVTTVTYLVTDASSNTATCSFDVTVDDVEAPLIVCPGNITQNNDATVCGAVVVYATPVGTDNCAGSITTLTGGLASGSLFPIGTTAVTYEVEDLTSNITSCSFNVTVNDTELPTITCNAPITVSNDAGVCGAVVTYTNTSTDNCPGQVITQTAGLASGSVFPIGTTTNTFVVTDASGNTATCSFNVTVNDTELPTITCNAPITVSNDAGVCGAVVTYTNTSTDNCPGQVITQTAGLASGSVFPIGTTTNTFVVTDASGNTATCSFNVTVNDTELPTITCNAPITVSNDAGVCGAVVTYTNTSTDNCPGQVITQTAGLASGSVFPIGTTTNTFVVTDASGNTATCSFNVTVNDTELPTITCNAPITVSNDAGVCGAVVTYTNTSTDNCPGQVITQTAGLASGSVFPIGTTTNTFVVTDASGNTATCSFNVTVNDTENPTIACPANITQSNDVGVCGATVTYAAPVGADNCAGSITTLTAGQASGTLFPIGTTAVTYLVTDASINTATCSFTVTVNDTQNPTIVCPANITQNNDAGVCGATVAYATPVGADNCAGSITTLTAGQASGTLFPIGTTTKTFVVTDASGNTATCSFNVTVNDTELPTITCNAPITVSNDAGVCGAVVTYTNTSTDNCPGQVITQTAGLASGSVFPIGTTTNTFVVTDASGNTATCSFNVTVNDTELPTITCNAPITMSNDAGVCGAVVTYTNTSNDNCPGQVITNSRTCIRISIPNRYNHQYICSNRRKW
ncbi:MAG: HYR domain-containing protein [Crocinitomicaceae bacterium]|nr:HYR domain-containing protein [Crocinitomicaceae bacterium]